MESQCNAHHFEVNLQRFPVRKPRVERIAFPMTYAPQILYSGDFKIRAPRLKNSKILSLELEFRIMIKAFVIEFFDTATVKEQHVTLVTHCSY